MKTVVKLKKAEGQMEFNLTKPGLYSICIQGGGYFQGLGVNDFEITRTKNQQIIELKETSLKWRFRKNWKMFIEYRQFNILDTGNYKIKIKNPGNKNSNRLILIKESVNVLKRFLGIFFLVFGVNGSFWAFYLAINPNPFV